MFACFYYSNDISSKQVVEKFVTVSLILLLASMPHEDSVVDGPSSNHICNQLYPHQIGIYIDICHIMKIRYG